MTKKEASDVIKQYISIHDKPKKDAVVAVFYVGNTLSSYTYQGLRDIVKNNS